MDAMSDIAITSPRTHAFDWPSSWIRWVRAVLAVPTPFASYLPAFYLRDIGLRSDQIARSVNEGGMRLGLLDLGWQSPRPRR
jgi:hypothetical protein